MHFQFIDTNYVIMGENIKKKQNGEHSRRRVDTLAHDISRQWVRNVFSCKLKVMHGLNYEFDEQNFKSITYRIVT